MESVRSAPTVALDAVTLYRILQLRVDVFVVEQQCAYRELDGRDLEPGTRQLWIPGVDSVRATLRVLVEPDGRARIGRVATLPSARGAGLGTALMKTALSLAGDDGRVAVLDAQVYLAQWYVGLGFVPDGPEFVEDGIPHVPMTLRRE